MFGFGSNSFSINQEDFLKIAAGGAHIIDVRSPEEFAQGNLKKSKNIPLNMMGTHLNEFKKYAENKQVVLLICLSGSRSAMAHKFLTKNNLADQVFDLSGGISRWKGPLK